MTIKSYFAFTKRQRAGLVALLVIITTIQVLYFVVDLTPKITTSADQEQWLRLQGTIDSLKLLAANQKPKVYPFNPNFISDFKGYRLGMSVPQIDRLHAFRERNLYVNSATEFQAVTKVSDSLLATMSPYFKFPDWVKNRKRNVTFASTKFERKKVIATDINTATQDELMEVYGIGPALSLRILKQRESLG
ncbi:MAG: helix-hairpin-helix domain-containing protein, partial [Proteobacteria bacterium]